MLYMMHWITLQSPISHLQRHKKVNPDKVLVLIKSSLWQSTEARTLSGFDCNWNLINKLSYSLGQLLRSYNQLVVPSKNTYFPLSLLIYMTSFQREISFQRSKTRLQLTGYRDHINQELVFYEMIKALKDASVDIMLTEQNQQSQFISSTRSTVPSYSGGKKYQSR